MNCEELLIKIRELNPECVVTYPEYISKHILRLFLLFIAKMQLGSSRMYSNYDVKHCKYMGKQFYRISYTFSSGGPFYPFVNVDASTLDMFHASGKVPRANLETMDYVCVGYGWMKRDNENYNEFDAFVIKHNLI